MKLPAKGEGRTGPRLSPMARYILKRVAIALVTLFVIMFVLSVVMFL